MLHHLFYAVLTNGVFYCKGTDAALFFRILDNVTKSEFSKFLYLIILVYAMYSLQFLF